eukprot:scaffold79648_cov19-Tisochrysis_lutea.AAC.1
MNRRTLMIRSSEPGSSPAHSSMLRGPLLTCSIIYNTHLVPQPSLSLVLLPLGLHGHPPFAPLGPCQVCLVGGLVFCAQLCQVVCAGAQYHLSLQQQQNARAYVRVCERASVLVHVCVSVSQHSDPCVRVNRYTPGRKASLKQFHLCGLEWPDQTRKI